MRESRDVKVEKGKEKCYLLLKKAEVETKNVIKCDKVSSGLKETATPNCHSKLSSEETGHR